MAEITPKTNRLLTVLVALLVIAVVVQIGYLYRMRHELRTVAEGTAWLMPVHSSHHSNSRATGTAHAAAPKAVRPNQDLNPLDEMQALQQNMNQMFDRALMNFNITTPMESFGQTSMFIPRVDLRDEGDHYLATVDLPGADKSKVDVRVEGQELKISGERSQAFEKTDKHHRAILSERSEGKFERLVPLPGAVQGDRLQTAYDNGILQVTIPKAETK